MAVGGGGFFGDWDLPGMRKKVESEYPRRKSGSIWLNPHGAGVIMALYDNICEGKGDRLYEKVSGSS